MARTDNDSKMMQSSRITKVGCIGVALVLVILILIGLVMVRGGLSSKRNVAMDALGRMREQVVKAPGVLNRMLANGCGEEAEQAVNDVQRMVDALSSEYTFDDMENAWAEIETAWALVSRGYPGSEADPVHVDFKTDMDGIRNRFSVEKGNYNRAADTYNSALRSFPGGLAGFGLKEL